MPLLSTLILLPILNSTVVYYCEESNGSLTLSDKPCVSQTTESMQVKTLDNLPSNTIPSPYATAEPSPPTTEALPIAVFVPLAQAAPSQPVRLAAEPKDKIGHHARMELKNLTTLQTTRQLTGREQRFLRAERRRIANGQFDELTTEQKNRRSNAFRDLGMGRSNDKIEIMIGTVEAIYHE